MPQICRSEPAVWDGIIAISTLFEYPDQCLDFTLLRKASTERNALNTSQQDALAWYSRSISSIHSQIERGSADPYVALVSCVLFICIETLQGRIEEALQLFEQGVRLIFDLRVQIGLGGVSATKAALLEDTIIPLFLRMGANSLTVSGFQAGGIFALADLYALPVFTSIDAARSAITILSAEAMLFDREARVHLQAVGGDAFVDPAMLQRQKNLQSRLLRWHQAYMDLCRTYDQGSKNPAKKESILLAYYAASYIHVSACLTQQETVYDSYYDDFLTIVEQASLALNTLAGPNGTQPPFTFEMGVGVPLFLTVLKCREPVLRRKALGLLQQSPPMQGFFKCTPVALLAENLMKIEESYTLTPEKPADSMSIPEEARICFYGIFRPSNGLPPSIKEEDFARYRRGPDQLFLEIARNRYDETNGRWFPVHEVLSLGP